MIQPVASADASSGCPLRRAKAAIARYRVGVTDQPR